MTPAEVRRVPAALEADLFRAVQALPGVTAPGLLSSRLLVRGGSADQNLFLLDGFPVIQPYHLGGAFSAFHTEAISDAQLSLGAPAARYGGALSSVLDVRLRDGNRERTTSTATLGLVSSAVVVEGGHPRGGWFVGGRRTYLDLAAKATDQNLPYYFYDTYAKSYADLGASDRISALIFVGRDEIYNRYKRDLQHFSWSNDVYGLSWRHLFSGHAVMEQHLSLSRFTQELCGGYSELQNAGIATDHDVRLLQARGDLRWDAAERHNLELGYLAQRQVGSHRVEYRYGWEYDRYAGGDTRGSGTLLAAYAQDDVELSERLRVRLGLRGEAAGPHRSLQPRISAKYLLSDAVALSAGAGTLRQYDQEAQDPDPRFDVYSVDLFTTAYAPDALAAKSAHLVGGVEVRLPGEVVFRGEAYAKRFSDVLVLAPFDPAAQKFAVERMQTATGAARGVDLSLARESPGRVRGWLGYSLASSSRTAEGERFAASEQPRQRIVAVWEMEPRRGWTLTGRAETSEGVAFTPVSTIVPVRDFDFLDGHFSEVCGATSRMYQYGARNSARTGWSRRLDLGAGKRWSDRRGWKWEIALSLLNVLVDPVGLLRPVAPIRQAPGCSGPAPVQWEPELILPPVPSVGVRLEF